MSAQMASLAVERLGTIVVVAVSGEVDMSNAGEIRQGLLQSVWNEDQALILDLSELSFIDSAGLHVVFDLLTILQERDKQMSLVVPPEIHPRRAIELVGLDGVLPIHSERDGAVKQARSRAGA